MRRAAGPVAGSSWGVAVSWSGASLPRSLGVPSLTHNSGGLTSPASQKRSTWASVQGQRAASCHLGVVPVSNLRSAQEGLTPVLARIRVPRAGKVSGAGGFGRWVALASPPARPAEPSVAGLRKGGTGEGAVIFSASTGPKASATDTFSDGRTRIRARAGVSTSATDSR